MKHLPKVLALCAAAFCASVTLAPQAVGAEPTTNQTVSVPNGHYGGSTAGGDMVSFMVRHRTLINPRVSIAVECTHPDGTSIALMFGPTEQNNLRSHISRNGIGSISWVQDTDESLIDNATVHLSYTLGHDHALLASVDVDARDSDVHCTGTTAFQLHRGPLPHSHS